MCFISNILGSGKLIPFLIVSISVNDVSRTGRRRQSAMSSGMLTEHCQIPKLRNVK
jgi:hydrogenase maturation factor